MMDDIEDPAIRQRRFSDIGLKRFSSSKLEDLFKSPGHRLSMLARKRKRNKAETNGGKKDDDTVSLQSVDITLDEPKKKRRSLSKISSSLVNMLSPVRPVKHVAGAMKRSLSSLSLNGLSSPKENTPKRNNQQYQSTPYRRPAASTTPKRRESTFWYQTMKEDDLQKLNKLQLKRQEAIYELLKGDMDLVEDLKMVKSHFYKSMKHLGLMPQEELDQIFGPIDVILPIHQSLVEELKDQRLPDGSTEFIGEVLLAWAPKLEGYNMYCANQVHAKPLLESKKQCPAIEDFLERCQECNFSRKLDLWTFLDVPRSRLVKYPLLLKSIQKYTPSCHTDYEKIKETIDTIEDIIKEVDRRMGEEKCKCAKDRLEYLSEDQKLVDINNSNIILCDGVLKNNRGTKLHVFLFEKVLVLTRLSTRTGQPRYQVHRQPLPVEDLCLQIQGEGKQGSFRSALSTNNTTKYSFKVSSMSDDKSPSHTLVAHDEHDKRQWITALRSVLPEGHEEKESSDDGNREGIDGFNTSDLSLGIPTSVKRSKSTVSDNIVSYDSKNFYKQTRDGKNGAPRKKRRSTIATETAVREIPEGCHENDSSFTTDNSSVVSSISAPPEATVDLDEIDVDEPLTGIRHIDSPVWSDRDASLRGSGDGQEDPNSSIGSAVTVI